MNHALAEARPDRYFLPPYVARRGWIGLWLDVGDVDWEEVAELTLDSYRLIRRDASSHHWTINSATGNDLQSRSQLPWRSMIHRVHRC